VRFTANARLSYPKLNAISKDYRRDARRVISQPMIFHLGRSLQDRFAEMFHATIEQPKMEGDTKSIE
jgi:hypothetical protein